MSFVRLLSREMHQGFGIEGRPQWISIQLFTCKVSHQLFCLGPFQGAHASTVKDHYVLHCAYAQYCSRHHTQLICKVMSIRDTHVESCSHHTKAPHNQGLLCASYSQHSAVRTPKSEHRLPNVAVRPQPQITSALTASQARHTSNKL